MRLPWPFSRPQHSAAAQSAPSSSAAEVFGAAPRGPQAWRDLPVLGTTMAKPPLVAPMPPFKADLAGAAQAPIALAPLTHGHGLDAPAGLARNVVTAVDHSAASGKQDGQSRPALAPPHRRSRGESAPVTAAADEAPAGAPSGQLPAAAVDIRAATPPSATGATPKVAAAASLVRADRQPNLPSLPVGKIGSARQAGGTQRAPIRAVSPAPPAASAMAALPETPATAVIAPRAVSAPESGERLTLGQSRRRGLGAPIDAPVLGLQRARDAAAPSANASESQLPVVTRSAVSAESVPASIANDPALSGSYAAAPAMTSWSLANTPSPAVASQPAVPSATRIMAAPIHQRAPRQDFAASRPTLGARPMAGRVQRAPLSAATRTTPSGGAAAASATSSSGPVRIHRGSEADEMAGALDARAFTNGGEIYLPDRHGPLSGGPAKALLAHEMTHVAQQRQLGSSLPHEDSAHGQHLEAQAVAAESSSNMPLATPARGEPGPSAEQRSDAQFVAGPDDTNGAAPSHVNHAQRAPSANDAVWSDPDDAFRDNLRRNEDELFATFERRLRHVLLHERERGGSLIDAL